MERLFCFLCWQGKRVMPTLFFSAFFSFWHIYHCRAGRKLGADAWIYMNWQCCLLVSILCFTFFLSLKFLISQHYYFFLLFLSLTRLTVYLFSFLFLFFFHCLCLFLSPYSFIFSLLHFFSSSSFLSSLFRLNRFFFAPPFLLFLHLLSFLFLPFLSLPFDAIACEILLIYWFLY